MYGRLGYLGATVSGNEAAPVVGATSSLPMFKPTLLQPFQPTSFTEAQQQSLDPVGYAKQQAVDEQAQQQQQADGVKSNQTLFILAAVAIACGVLYFMFKDKE